jgi:hypothetical protein
MLASYYGSANVQGHIFVQWNLNRPASVYKVGKKAPRIARERCVTDVKK